IRDKLVTGVQTCALPIFHEYLKPGRILIFGESEIRFLESLESRVRSDALRLALGHDFPCVIITGGFTPPGELIIEAERASVPLRSEERRVGKEWRSRRWR